MSPCGRAIRYADATFPTRLTSVTFADVTIASAASVPATSPTVSTKPSDL